jgi:BirA family biotin operon repressor/biotin-[acetyl-CoA-carboxylase] ligase
METLFIGKNLLFLHEVESTNTYAIDLLRSVNVIEGTIIYANHQTKGKGQRGATWRSEIGQNITASVILKPYFLSQKDTFYLSKISALAVYDALTDILTNSQYDIKIKWPNDILINRHKIAGILIENTFNASSLQYAVIGIGINVNQVNFDDINYLVTSIKLLTKMNFEKEDVLKILSVKLEKWYLKLKNQQFEFIDNQYIKALFGMHEKLMFKNKESIEFEGEIIGVKHDGKLLLNLNEKEIHDFDIKEITFLIH